MTALKRAMGQWTAAQAAREVRQQAVRALSN